MWKYLVSLGEGLGLPHAPLAACHVMQLQHLLTARHPGVAQHIPATEPIDRRRQITPVSHTVKHELAAKAWTTSTTIRIGRRRVGFVQDIIEMYHTFLTTYL
jgi:hypothetical protein